MLHALRKLQELLTNLVGQLSSLGNHETLMRQVFSVDFRTHLVKNAKGKDCSLSSACLGLKDDIVALDNFGDGLDLNGTRVLESHDFESVEKLISEKKVLPKSAISDIGYLCGLQVHRDNLQQKVNYNPF